MHPLNHPRSRAKTNPAIPGSQGYEVPGSPPQVSLQLIPGEAALSVIPTPWSGKPATSTAWERVSCSKRVMAEKLHWMGLVAGVCRREDS